MRMTPAAVGRSPHSILSRRNSSRGPPPPDPVCSSGSCFAAAGRPRRRGRGRCWRGRWASNSSRLIFGLQACARLRERELQFAAFFGRCGQRTPLRMGRRKDRHRQVHPVRPVTLSVPTHASSRRVPAPGCPCRGGVIPPSLRCFHVHLRTILAVQTRRQAARAYRFGSFFPRDAHHGNGSARASRQRLQHLGRAPHARAFATLFDERAPSRTISIAVSRWPGRRRRDPYRVLEVPCTRRPIRRTARGCARRRCRLRAVTDRPKVARTSTSGPNAGAGPMRKKARTGLSSAQGICTCVPKCVSLAVGVRGWRSIMI